MKELEIELTKNGFDYRQIRKNEKAYIYSQSLNGKIIAYEVFEHKVNQYYNCVSFPTSNAFGVWAWTYHNLQDAVNKYNQISI